MFLQDRQGLCDDVHLLRAPQWEVQPHGPQGARWVRAGPVCSPRVLDF